MPKKTSTPSPRSTLLAHAKRIPREDHFHDDLLPGSEPPSLDEIIASTKVSTLLAVAMLQCTLSKRDNLRLREPGGLAMTVTVPDASWMTPVSRALTETRTWADILKRSGASRTYDRPDNGSDGVADALSAGHSILGVSTDPVRFLPSALVAAADLRVTIGNPGPKVIRAVIGLVTGQSVRTLKPDVAQGLSADEIASCIRKGTTARACVRRLEAASRSKRAPVTDLADVPFLADCHGYGECAEWGLRLVSAVEEARRGQRNWSSIEDKNVVISGEAGVGKTTFARSLAKSLNMPLIATSVSSWFAQTGGYLNDICRKVDEVFQQAAAQGAVLLLDECDSIPNRETCDPRHREYWVPVVSHILMTLDGAVSGSASKIIVVGATNFPERLDGALTRPGRLNRVIHIGRPDTAAIAGIARQHLGDDLAGEDLTPLAAIGSGATGAQVAGWVRNARMAAGAAGRRMVRADLVAQIAPPDTRSPADLLSTARHESSHGVALERCQPGAIQTMSIVPRGPYAGLTSSRLRDATFMSADDLDSLVVATLAGRAADAHWGKATAGSAGGEGSDLAVATALVAGKHGSLGLGGSLVYRGARTETASILRDPAFLKVVHSDLDRLFALAVAFVRANEVVIDAVAKRLLARRVVGGDEVRAIIAAHPQTRSHAVPVIVGGIHA